MDGDLLPDKFRYHLHATPTGILPFLGADDPTQSDEESLLLAAITFTEAERANFFAFAKKCLPLKLHHGVIWAPNHMQTFSEYVLNHDARRYVVRKSKSARLKQHSSDSDTSDSS